MLCLKTPTDPRWAIDALEDVDAVLVDHAHCEMKAASNALALAARHPGDLGLVSALADVASEEIQHFKQVVDRLASRGVALGPPPVDLYAAELRRVVHDNPPGPQGSRLVDRLLVAALIEARSCERFKLLAAAARDRVEALDLAEFWTELFAAEAGHYRTFVDLAARAAGRASHAAGGPAHAPSGPGGAGSQRPAVEARLEELATLEGEIVASLARRDASDRAAIHG